MPPGSCVSSLTAMCRRGETRIIRFIILALFFVILAGGIYVTVGKEFKSALSLKMRMAIEQGIPVGDYLQKDSPPQEGELKRSEADLPNLGSCYGRILCEKIGLSAPLYYGDSDVILEKGAGQYISSGLPGEGRPILVGAHDIGYFEPLKDIEQGDRIELTTSYGVFQYQVTDITVGEASSIGKKELRHPYEELILYTCYPFGGFLEEKSQRYFVAAEKISGPILKEDSNEGQQ